MKNRNLTGGLFDGRGKPQPLRPSKAKQITTPEKHIQSSFIAWRNIHKREFPILNSIFAVPNGAMLFNKAIAVSQVQQGLTKGIPDVICLAPSFDKKYHALLIEFKTETGKVSESQDFFIAFFAELGFQTKICRTAFDASNAVNEHLNLKIPIYPR